MFYVWGVVLAGNLAGGIIGAYGLAKLDVFSAGAATAATSIATKALETQWWTLFHHGAIAGFIVAGLVWLDYAANDTATRFLLVYIAFFAISAASLNHSVVTAVEALYLYFNQAITLTVAFSDLFLPVVLGNTVGGVFLVTVVNYFQTPDFINQDASIRLSWKDWLFDFKTFQDA
jgi:formate/nitrite transporter FocA (FNT family)